MLGAAKKRGPALSDAVRYVASDRVLLTRMPDGTGLLLHLDSKFYFTLNGTGTFVWDRLSTKPHSIAELASALSARYAVSAAEAETDTRQWLELLEAENAVERR